MSRRVRYTGSDLMIPGFAPRLLVEADGLAWWVSDVGDLQDHTLWWFWWTNAVSGQKAVPSQ